MKKRIGSLADCDALDHEGRISFSVLSHNEILQITEVWMRILCVVDPVMGICGVEVAAGGTKSWPFALPDRVDVNAECRVHPASAAKP
jgi:hypothetical protein